MFRRHKKAVWLTRCSRDRSSRQSRIDSVTIRGRGFKPVCELVKLIIAQGVVTGFAPDEAVVSDVDATHLVVAVATEVSGRFQGYALLFDDVPIEHPIAGSLVMDTSVVVDT